ncbi:hypothetical protein WR25_22681 [Diploscapter pachys]|uniref:Uncharacterized protein n=1 Tax=Diploscapter pachys TaxID=2018661 RepID=A0A2A2KB27_9BILA|nr:hypothetical protein WR25_22681 [Diploscapter pachys]
MPFGPRLNACRAGSWSLSRTLMTDRARCSCASSSAKRIRIRRAGSRASRPNAPRLSTTTRLAPSASTCANSWAPSWSSRPSVVDCQLSCTLPSRSSAGRSKPSAQAFKRNRAGVS